MSAPASSNLDRLTSFLIFALFFGGGGFLLSIATPRLLDGWSAGSWAQVQGHVADVRVEESHSGKKQWYEVTVVYSFEANGRLHRGDRLELWPVRLQRNPARALARRFPVTDPVTVYYDPADPTRSLLDRTTGGGTWLIAGIGVLALTLGLIPLIGGKKKGVP